MRAITETGNNLSINGTSAARTSSRTENMTQADIVDPRVSEQATVIGSNSLPELAARIRAEHAATGEALKSSIDHSIAAGELLIEAKAKVPHGEWLPWLG